MPKDEREVPRTEEEHLMRRLLDRGAACRWEQAENGRKIVFEFPMQLNDFSEMMMRRSTPGYAMGARLFYQKMTIASVERAVQSHLLTRLARALHDCSYESRKAITEPEVAMFGQFIAELIGTCPEMLVAWAEDMNVDDPENDFQKQPTAVIRGVFLSTAVIQRKDAVRFWELAAKSLQFPLRIFSHPCEPRYGELFAPFHLRAFSIVFGLVSLAAVERFAGYMRKHARLKVKTEALGDGKWKRHARPVSEDERQLAFGSVVDGIDSGPRRREVATLLGVAAA